MFKTKFRIRFAALDLRPPRIILINKTKKKPKDIKSFISIKLDCKTKTKILKETISQ